MGKPVWLCGWLFALAAFCGSGAMAPAFAEEGEFFRNHPTLRFIEQRLPPGTTIVIPPSLEPVRRVATDAELRTAFAGVLDEFLAPPATFAGKAGDLIGAVCRYRPAQAVLWLAAAADSLLGHLLPSTERDLNAAVAAAITASPREAGPAVRAVIGRIAAHAQAGGLDRETSVRMAGDVVLTAVKTAKELRTAPPIIAEIAEHAIDETLARDASDLAVVVTAAAVQAVAASEGAKVAELATITVTKFGRTKLLASLLSAAALKGAGVEAVVAINDAAAINLPVAFASYTNIACSSLVAITAAPEAAAFNVGRLITVARADYIPAVIIGAIVAHPQAAAEILEAGLNRDLVLRGRATTRDIVEAAVLACPGEASRLAAAAVGHGDLQEGNSAAQIAEGVARGAPATAIGAALTAQINAQEKTAATLRSTVAGAIAGAVATGKRQALSAIAFAAAADAAFAGDVLDQAIVSAPPELQYCGVVAVLAAHPEQAGALLERALRHGDLAAGQAAPIRAAGKVILAIQADSASSFRVTARELASLAEASPEVVDAIVLGASLANPGGAPAVAAVAAVGSGVSLESLIATAVQADPAALVRIVEAAGVAIELKSNQGTAFRTVQRAILARPEWASEIVTGALAAAPAHGPVIGYAAARAMPVALARIVPRLFAFSSGGGELETMVALTGSVIHGVIDAELEPAAESAAMADAVAASIRSAVALARSGVAMVSEGEALVAVTDAAARAARGHAVTVAQVAARSARALSAPAPALAGVRNAVLAVGPRAEAAKIADAVAAGIAEADLQKPAASARQLLDYAHDSLTGVPMTQFRDF